MQVKVEVKKGKIVSNNTTLRDYFTSLDDGEYIISIDRINPLISPRDFQKAYFDKIDICVSCTGNDRYTIHEAFKEHSAIESTKDLDVKDWRDLLGKFSWWAYDTFNCFV